MANLLILLTVYVICTYSMLINLSRIIKSGDFVKALYSTVAFYLSAFTIIHDGCKVVGQLANQTKKRKCLVVSCFICLSFSLSQSSLVYLALKQHDKLMMERPHSTMPIWTPISPIYPVGGERGKHRGIIFNQQQRGDSVVRTLPRSK